MDIKQVVAMLQETGEVFIDCGQGCSPGPAVAPRPFHAFGL